VSHWVSLTLLSNQHLLPLHHASKCSPQVLHGHPIPDCGKGHLPHLHQVAWVSTEQGSLPTDMPTAEHMHSNKACCALVMA